jgi:PleD family two-component response regulator
MSLFARRPDDALKAAIAMLEEIVVYNSHRSNCGYRPIGIGIGLHMGTLMLGMIGEAQRLEGTVIADAVNLASRLEGLTKIYDASIVVSEQTINSLQDRQAYNYRFLDKVRVKGKRETVSVYEVFDGEAPESKALKLATKPDFEAGLVAYHDQLYAEAKDQFNQVLATNPNDKVAQIYLQRTETALYMNDFAVTVLLVDDQPMVAEAVRRMLANEDDIQFHCCQYPQEAIPQANQLGPTVILQDLVMPEVDGLTLVRFYRANEATRDIPVIVLSTQEGSQTKAEAFAAGVNDYLIKLPDPIELIARIRHHSQGYINLRQRNRVAYLMEQGYLSGVDLAAISSEAPV